MFGGAAGLNITTSVLSSAATNLKLSLALPSAGTSTNLLPHELVVYICSIKLSPEVKPPQPELIDKYELPEKTAIVRQFAFAPVSITSILLPVKSAEKAPLLATP